MKQLIIAGALLLSSTPLLLSAASGDTLSGTLDRPMHQEWTGTGAFPPPARVQSGAEDPLKPLHLAIGKLSSTDRDELIKIIRTYVEGKGITIPTAEATRTALQENRQDRKEVRKEIQGTRQETRKEIKDTKQKATEQIKQTRESLRNRVQNRRNSTPSENK